MWKRVAPHLPLSLPNTAVLGELVTVFFYPGYFLPQPDLFPLHSPSAPPNARDDFLPTSLSLDEIVLPRFPILFLVGVRFFPSLFLFFFWSLAGSYFILWGKVFL